MDANASLRQRAFSTAVALVGAFIFFAIAYYTSYSPERLLVQGFCVAVFIDGLSRALASPSASKAFRAIAGIAFFIGRGGIVGVLISLVIRSVGESVDHASVDVGWALAFDVGRIIFFSVFFVSLVLGPVAAIIAAVIGDIYGRADPFTDAPDKSNEVALSEM